MPGLAGEEHRGAQEPGTDRMEGGGEGRKTFRCGRATPVGGGEPGKENG